eukprot:3709258-Amphidinium_carterae.1
MRFALEERIGAPIDDKHAALTWMPMMAADAITHFRVLPDGVTAEQRRSGKSWRKSVAEFGERVYYRPALAKQPASGMTP